MVGDSGALAWHGHAGSARVDGTRSVVLVLEEGIDNAGLTTPWQYAARGFVVQVLRGLRPPSTPARTPPVSARWTIGVGTRSTIHP